MRWMRWHCPPDTGFEIRALAVWGRARYLSVTEAPHNTDFHTWMGKKYFCFFETAETGNRTPNSGVKGSGANHYPRAPAPAVQWNRTAPVFSWKLRHIVGFGLVEMDISTNSKATIYLNGMGREYAPWSAEILFVVHSVVYAKGPATFPCHFGNSYAADHDYSLF